MYTEYDHFHLKKECDEIKRIRIQHYIILHNDSYKYCCWKLGRGYRSD